MPWRVYRPAVVVGHSETGAMDKIDGPYYFFPLFKRMRDTLPGWMPAGRRRPRRHQRGAGRLRRQGDGPHRAPARTATARPSTSSTPSRQHRRPGQHLRRGREGAAVRRTRRPRASPPGCPRALLPRALQPVDLLGAALRTRAGAAGAEPDDRPARHPARGARARLVPHRSTPRARPRRRSPGSGISVPDLDSYASTLWSYWEEMLDDSIKSDSSTVKALTGKTVVITGASSGIGLVTAVQVAKAGGDPDPGRARAGQARGHQGADRVARAATALRLPVRPLRPARHRRADQAAVARTSTTSTSWSTTPAARSGAR